MDKNNEETEECSERDSISSPTLCGGFTVEIIKKESSPKGTIIDLEVGCSINNFHQILNILDRIESRPWSFEEELVLKEIIADMKVDIKCGIQVKEIGKRFNKIMTDRKGNDYDKKSDVSILKKCISILKKPISKEKQQGFF